MDAPPATIANLHPLSSTHPPFCFVTPSRLHSQPFFESIATEGHTKSTKRPPFGAQIYVLELLCLPAKPRGHIPSYWRSTD
ncbi:hypothetical protein CDL15_Pgr012586 [Punica granatum]|uniref:Uncharacterized protein n=1 Tax=Punica granatum TaxID=22663 RepID=A0A218XZC1_PUNGR|nr:hypothetical protein CDL15_Pgr012586 [Punica granatum]